ncbi:hypothetical protein [Nocardioides sp. Soil796]|uniref:hypothetical protein n=1 Tax=Nocardioides sp. Soil796 TaxID=1736412 RepID=UPI00070D3CF8|nr:hypothetical protein [Nocardioides sp. Soil796]KRF19650.1 hypothetical protein ASH02_24150 [Nocardioides sp. Soil796]
MNDKDRIQKALADMEEISTLNTTEARRDSQRNKRLVDSGETYRSQYPKKNFRTLKKHDH